MREPGEPSGASAVWPVWVCAGTEGSVKHHKNKVVSLWTCVGPAVIWGEEKNWKTQLYSNWICVRDSPTSVCPGCGTGYARWGVPCRKGNPKASAMFEPGYSLNPFFWTAIQRWASHALNVQLSRLSPCTLCTPWADGARLPPAGNLAA